jgi:hypothetical protein
MAQACADYPSTRLRLVPLPPVSRGEDYLPPRCLQLSVRVRVQSG